VSLGCAKNEVDSERILAALVEDGFLIAQDPADADAVLVNTCGFVAAARDEAREVVRELVELKGRGGRGGRGSFRLLGVLGCMVERLGDKAGEELPGVGLFLGLREYPRLCARLRGALGLAARDREGRDLAVCGPRLRIGYPHRAYLKISEGCDNRCGYCAVPLIRGPQRSRRIEDVIEEAGELIALGAVEINVIAQDTGTYGRDLYGRPMTAELLSELARLEGARWVRLLYCHPAHLSEEILAIFSRHDNICAYLDLPVQHSDGALLARVGRDMPPGDAAEWFSALRDKLPGVALRSSVIVGMPGEGEREFRGLIEFMEKVRFDSLGAFVYSPEAGTGAANLAGRVDGAEALRRLEDLMEVQRSLSSRIQASHVGRREEVLIDGAPREDGLWPARSRAEAPEIDPVVWVRGDGFRPGEFLTVRVEAAADYDRTARPLVEGT